MKNRKRILNLLQQAEFAVYEAWVAAEEAGHARWEEIAAELDRIARLRLTFERQFFGYVR
jgi:hypothetical protein